ncbi:MAG: DUF542 domain-containing protein [Planctomycetaceae bacterium]
MNEPDLETSAADWVIDHPAAAHIFDELGIDYSCAGKSLRYLCEQQNQDPQAVVTRLLSIIAFDETE